MTYAVSSEVKATVLILKKKRNALLLSSNNLMINPQRFKGRPSNA